MLKESQLTLSSKKPLKCLLIAGFVQQTGLILVPESS